MIIAKPIETEQLNNGQYELFSPITMKGVDGEDVQVLQSIGHYSLEQLEQEKVMTQSQIVEVDKKITAIEDLNK